jgi:hypothetical protein
MYKPVRVNGPFFRYSILNLPVTFTFLIPSCASVEVRQTQKNGLDGLTRVSPAGWFEADFKSHTCVELPNL